MKSLKIIIAIVWILFLGMAALIFFEVRRGDSLRQEVAAVTKRIDDAEKARPKLAILAKDIDDLEVDLSKINLKIPDNEKVPLELIKRLTVLANKSRLKKIEFSYGDNASSGALQKTTAEGLRVDTSIINLSCEAEYPRLMAFLKQVSEMDRILYVDEIKISRVKETNPRQRIAIKLLGYTFITNP